MVNHDDDICNNSDCCGGIDRFSDVYGIVMTVIMM